MTRCIRGHIHTDPYRDYTFRVNSRRVHMGLGADYMHHSVFRTCHIRSILQFHEVHLYSHGTQDLLRRIGHIRHAERTVHRTHRIYTWNYRLRSHSIDRRRVTHRVRSHNRVCTLDHSRLFRTCRHCLRCLCMCTPRVCFRLNKEAQHMGSLRGVVDTPHRVRKGGLRRNVCPSVLLVVRMSRCMIRIQQKM